MATPSETPGPEWTGPDRRLHPLSWVFVLVAQLRAYAIPLAVLLITGRGNGYEFVGLYGVGLLVVVAVARYFTYRFGLGPDGVVIRSGLLQTTRRDIPYERIHNVSLHRSLLHRWLGVADVRLESAGGAKAEAEMRVLSVADAQALEGSIRERGRASRIGAPTTDGLAQEADARPLIAMSTAEVVRLGLISNRGTVLVAAAVGALSQVVPEGAFWPNALGWIAEHLTSDVLARLPDQVAGQRSAMVLGTALLVVVALVAVRFLSVVLALLQFHGFRLDEVGRQLRVERGLLTRVRTYLPRGRIQAWRVRETLLHRWFGRQSLRVDSAGGSADEDHHGVRDLAPAAPPEAVQALVRHVLRREDWPPLAWRGLHPQAWRRLLVAPSALVIAVTAGLASRFGVAGLAGLIVLPLIVWRARRWAVTAGYTELPGLVAVRTGWLSRRWQFTEVPKLQTLRLTSSPFDRRYAMATLWLDTAGAGSRDGVLRIPYLPADDARALHARLAAGMDAARRETPAG